MNKLTRTLERLHSMDWASVFIRLALGIVFISAGWSKVSGIEGVIAFFGTLGLAPIFAYLVAYVELIAGIFMILGVWVRYAGMALFVIMLVAILEVHLPNGYSLSNNGYEYSLVLLLLSLSSVALGEGKYSLTRLFK